jgi:hypothetical protein
MGSVGLSTLSPSNTTDLTQDLIITPAFGFTGEFMTEKVGGSSSNHVFLD